MAILEVQGLRKSFGDLEVLKGIDLSLEQGVGALHHRVLWQRQGPPCCGASTCWSGPQRAR